MTNKKIPTEKPIAWLALLPQLLLMSAIFAAFYFLNIKEPLFLTASIYLILSYSLKAVFLKDHNKGIKLTKEGKNKEAIASFEKSAKFFADHLWIDQYRFITLLSAAKHHYREMALVNIGYCYMELNDPEKAKKYYERTVREYPDNEMAKLGLSTIESKENKI